MCLREGCKGFGLKSATSGSVTNHRGVARLSRLGYLYFPAPGPRPWPQICIYRPWPPICIYGPWHQICIYRPWPSTCIYQPWPPMCVDRQWSKIIHLLALVPKVYLPSQAPAIVSGLCLPFHVKILLLPKLLVLLLLMIILTTKNAFVAAKSALNDP